MLTALKAHSRSHILAAWIFTWLALAACHLLDDPEPTPTPAPTATATPVKIRLGKESAEAWQNIPPGTDAARPGETPERPSGSAGFSRYVFEQVGDSVLATLVEGPRAGQVRVPASYQQLKERHEAGGPTDDLHMAGDELEALVHQLDVVRESTERYRDIDTALADGYAQSTEEVPNMGAHFVHPWRALDGIFDPSRPEILLYTKDENDEWELVGTSFVQPLNMAGPDHPDAFAGPLDNWHIHYELCTNTERTSRSSTEQECREEGGTWVPVYGWMIHAWVWVDNPLGVFNMWNPNIAPIASTSEIRRAVNAGDELTVAIENFGYGEAAIRAGESLTWTNVDGVAHTVTTGSRGRAGPGFDSGPVAPGASFQMTFDKPGRFAYTCTLHSFMSGTVVVTP